MMHNIFVGNSWWQLLLQASLLSKTIVALAFAVLVVATFILFFKMWDLREKQHNLVHTRKLIQDVATFDDLLSLKASVKSTIAGTVMAKGLHIVQMLLQTHEADDVKAMTHNDVTLLQSGIEQSVEHVAFGQGEYLPFLYAAAAAAPLVGLFGTVSGLITAFVQMAAARTTDITALAPGIAEALLTTLAGLIVAIPTLIMYHYLAIRVQAVEHQLDKLGHHLAWKVKSLLVP